MKKWRDAWATCNENLHYQTKKSLTTLSTNMTGKNFSFDFDAFFSTQIFFIWNSQQNFTSIHPAFTHKLNLKHFIFIETLLFRWILSIICITFYVYLSTCDLWRSLNDWPIYFREIEIKQPTTQRREEI